jgi:hypothetical protein
MYVTQRMGLDKRGGKREAHLVRITLHAASGYQSKSSGLNTRYMTIKAQVGEAHRTRNVHNAGPVGKLPWLYAARASSRAAAARSNFKQEGSRQFINEIPVNQRGSKSARAHLEPHGPTGSLTSRRTTENPPKQ